MADATAIVPDGIENSSEDNSQQHNSQPKVYSEDAFKEVIAARDAAKEKLRKIEAQAETDAKKREEDGLKAKNDFEGLTKLHQAEHDKALNSAKSLITNNFLASLAVKNGLTDPADIALFKGAIELDENFNVKNGADIEKQFEDFKKQKPYLFKTEDKKPVPKTDNLPFKKITGDVTPVTREQAQELAGQEIAKAYFSKHH